MLILRPGPATDTDKNMPREEEEIFKSIKSKVAKFYTLRCIGFYSS